MDKIELLIQVIKEKIMKRYKIILFYNLNTNKEIKDQILPK
jgi:hypothetical protein